MKPRSTSVAAPARAVVRRAFRLLSTRVLLHPSLRTMAALALLLLALALPSGTSDPAPPAAASLPPGGAPPPGSGTVHTTPYVRVLDGNTIDVLIKGQQVAVRFPGIDVPQGNTACGIEATKQLWTLVKGGELTLEEDNTASFDAYRMRLYHARNKSGQSLSEELVKAGLAKVNGKAEAKHLFTAAEVQAKTAKQGCLWKGGGTSDVVDPRLTEAGLGGTDTLRAIPAAPVQATPTLDTILPPGFAIQTVAANINEPVGFAFAPDGRVFIAAKHGLVWVLKGGNVLPTSLIDLSAKVNDYDDHGLLGIAVDPDFAANGFIYLLYTDENNAADYSGTKTARLARYTVVGDTASPATEQVLVGTQVGSSCKNFPAGADCIPSDFISHSIGSVRFAADGTLFASTGDAASFNDVNDDALRAQDIDNLAGKILHVTTAGQGVAGNPFSDGTLSHNRSKVWAYGLRNPFRFSLRPGTSIPYVGDVGWNAYEKEVVAVKGGNFGWPCYEGNFQQSGYAAKPTCQTLYAQGTGAVKFGLVTYDHLSNGQVVSTAAIGGAFYTGTTYPAQYQGAYVFGDLQGWLRTVKVDANDALVSGPTDFAPNTDIPTDIQMGPDGNLWVAAVFTQEVHEIVYNGNAPVAKAAADKASGPPPLTVNLSSAGSTDPAGGTLSYFWDFGDNTNSTAANPTHTFTLAACSPPPPAPPVVICTFTPTVTVTSSVTGATGTAGVNVTVSTWSPPTATIDTPSGSLTYKVGDVISFSGHAVDPQEGTLAAAGLQWQMLIHHCPGGSCHIHFLTSPQGVTDGRFTIPDHGDESYFEIVLTATDGGGLADTKSVTIHPQTAVVTLQTSPAGFQINYDGTNYTAPHTFNSVVGSQHTLTAPTQGAPPFVGWSDGGATQHNITVGTSALTFTATYQAVAPLPGARPAGPPSGTPPAPLPPPRPGSPAGANEATPPPAPLPPRR